MVFNFSEGAEQHRNHPHNHIKRKYNKYHILREFDKHYAEEYDKKQKPLAEPFFAFGFEGRIRYVRYHQ